MSGEVTSSGTIPVHPELPLQKLRCATKELSEKPLVETAEKVLKPDSKRGKASTAISDLTIRKRAKNGISSWASGEGLIGNSEVPKVQMVKLKISNHLRGPFLESKLLKLTEAMDTGRTRIYLPSAEFSDVDEISLDTPAGIASQSTNPNTVEDLVPISRWILIPSLFLF